MSKSAYREPAFDDSAPPESVEVHIRGLRVHPTAPELFILEGANTQPIDGGSLESAIRGSGVCDNEEEIAAATDAAIATIRRRRLAYLIAERMEVVG